MKPRRQSSWNWSRRWLMYGDSMAGILLRFTYANALPFQTLKRLVSGPSGISEIGTHLFSTGGVDHGWEPFCEAVEITVDEAKKSLFGDVLETLMGSWVVARHLRFCPECLKIGYHARYFQLLSLAECPIHHLTLLDECPNCGAKTPNYRICKELLSAVYCCPTCGMLYGGSRISIHAFFNPGMTNEQLEAVWEPLDHWIESIRKADLNYSSLREWIFEFAGEFRSEREVDALHVLGAIVPLPKGNFVWRPPSLPKKCMFVAEGNTLPRRHYLNGSYVVESYKDAKSSIERRLIAERLETVLKICRDLGWSGLRPSILVPSEIAYVLWRYQFENLSEPSLIGYEGRGESVFLRNNIPHTLGNLKPAGWRILFWAAYRGMIFDVERVLESDGNVTRLVRDNPFPQCCILASTSLRSDGRGVIVFPIPRFTTN
jgi:hypothetical protein